MKKLYFTLIVLVGSYYLNAQDVFYYYEGKAINLFEDKTSIVLIFKENSTYKNRKETFKNDTSIVEIDASDGTEDIFFARISYKQEQKDILSKISTYGISENDLETYGYGYKNEKGHRLWATNEVLFKLNSISSIEDIDDLLKKYDARFFELDKYGLYSYKVRRIEDAFKLSNELVENGYVIFAEPDFYQESELTQKTLSIHNSIT